MAKAKAAPKSNQADRHIALHHAAAVACAGKLTDGGEIVKIAGVFLDFLTGTTKKG